MTVKLAGLFFIIGLMIVATVPSLLVPYVATVIVTFIYTTISGLIKVPLLLAYQSGLRIKFLKEVLQKNILFYLGLSSFMSGVVDVFVLYLLSSLLDSYRFGLALVWFVILVGFNYQHRMKSFEFHELLGKSVSANIKNERISLIGHLIGLLIGWILV
jgi:hypothetical protein